MLVHADDFGISLEQSKDILTCSAACGGVGALNSTSALVTAPAFEKAAVFARPFVDAGCIHMGLHLNLVEGPALSSPDAAALLVGDDGQFQMSFAKMLAVSAGPLHDTFVREVRSEARAQIRTFLQAFPDMQGRLRVDSHQHTHLIPAVFDGLLAAVADEGCTLEYLRVPAEPLAPYMKVQAVRQQVTAVNVVKNALLNALWRMDAAKYPQALPKPALFFGLALSGRMQHAAHPAFLEEIQAQAVREGREVELLFHPGGVSNASECLAPQAAGFREFYLSPNRAAERQALQRICSS